MENIPRFGDNRKVICARFNCLVDFNAINISCIFRVLRKCGKKMPRYCDVNNDKKITLSEWLNCLQINNNPTLTKSSENSKFLHDIFRMLNALKIYSYFRLKETVAIIVQTERTESIGFLFKKWLTTQYEYLEAALIYIYRLRRKSIERIN